MNMKPIGNRTPLELGGDHIADVDGDHTADDNHQLCFKIASIVPGVRG